MPSGRTFATLERSVEHVKGTACIDTALDLRAHKEVEGNVVHMDLFCTQSVGIVQTDTRVI